PGRTRKPGPPTPRSPRRRRGTLSRSRLTGATTAATGARLGTSRRPRTHGATIMSGRLFDKVWQRHLVASPDGEPPLLYVDLHLVHEVTSPQAFEGIELAGRTVRRPDLTVATMGHDVPTTNRLGPISCPPT